jgi:ADP-ribose pyrophosphatase
MDLPDILGSQELHRGWARIYLDRLRTKRTGKEWNCLTAHIEPGVVILPFTDRHEVVMIEQYRHAVRTVLQELPGGALMPGEDILAGANRELKEETGYTAGELEHLGTVNPAAGLLSLPLHIVAARKLSLGEQQMDDVEDITVKLVPYDTLKRELRDGRHLESGIYAAVLLYELRKQP